MNKKIIALAVAAAVAAPLAAQAETKISGKVGGEFTSNTINSAASMGFADHGMGRLQFDVTDESGWYARSAFDTRLTQNSGNGPGYRDQYAGYKGSFGSVQFGKVANVGQNLLKDPFIATFLEARNAGTWGGSWGDASFNTSMVQYMNSFGDMKLAVEYGPSSNAASTADNQGAYGVALTGKAGGVDFWAGTNNMGNVTGSSMMKAGAAMSFGGIKLTLNYDSKTVSNTATAKMLLDAQMKMGTGMLDVAFADKGKDTTGAFMRVGYQIKVSNAVTANIGYASNGTDATTKDDSSMGAGVVVNF